MPSVANRRSLCIIQILFCSCAIRFPSQTDSVLTTPIQNLPNQHILTIPTPDGFNQAVHPDIVYFKNKFRGYSFYFTCTPYPFSNSKFENPCIYVSENGLDFFEDVPGTNPLVSQPVTGHNDDPDLGYNQTTRSFILYYLETALPDSQNLIALKSEDGIHWSKRKLMHDNIIGGDPLYLSPSSVQYGSNIYLFFINVSKTHHTIQYMKSRDGMIWGDRTKHSIEVELPDGLNPWHIDIIKTDRMFYMLCCGPYPNTDLYLARSYDLNHWVFLPDPILKNADFFFGKCDRIYRSTGIVEGDILAVWFSYFTFEKTWRIGFKKFILDSAAFEKESP